MSDLPRLIRLLNARHSCISILTLEEDEALTLVREAAVELGIECRMWSMNGGLRDALIDNAPAVVDTDHPAAAMLHLQTLPPSRRVVVALDLLPHLSDARTVRHFRDALASLERAGSTMVLIDQSADRPPLIGSIACAFELSLPDDKQIEEVIRSTIRERNAEGTLQVNLSREDAATIVRNLKGLTARQIRRIISDAVAEDRRLDSADLPAILAEKRRALRSAGLLEFVDSPVNLDEIGGLGRLKAWLCQRQKAFSKEAVKFGLTSPRGVLMLGVQGAGKSLAAKAVAAAWQLPLMRMDVGALYDRYVGESERRLRDSLRQAEMMAPVVLWIDEIEKAFASAASRSTDGGLSQRMFGTLLTWMQERAGQVFIIATANDIEALPPELLRKGRFDEIFFVDLPSLEARAHIFTIHLKKRGRNPKQFGIEALAEASEGYSGAEIEQAVVSGLHAAFEKSSELTTELILEALKGSPPISVTMRERIAALREWAAGRCVPAD